MYWDSSATSPGTFLLSCCSLKRELEKVAAKAGGVSISGAKPTQTFHTRFRLNHTRNGATGSGPSFSHRSPCGSHSCQAVLSVLEPRTRLQYLAGCSNTFPSLPCFYQVPQSRPQAQHCRGWAPFLLRKYAALVDDAALGAFGGRLF